ncbi:tyrosine-protein kinase ABL1 isoform X2 [Folsomia candida]|uniref:tyrosine-protein kinase ABL1 isoform X2 n=1 Tax=Folsomia candida TaxID=158441 RepID=UPI000B8F3F3D|nr:tyrosine-protein kinase ABL1 isoform X2 [Folsomia candida]
MAHYLIPRNQLSFNKNHDFLGGGAFGNVYKAIWNGSGVAVKILNDDDNPMGDKVWAEVNKMQRLDHPNILKLVGIVPPVKYGNPWIITELLETDLLQHIHNYPGHALTVRVMVGWAYDVVCGMEYMHHIASPFAIHGDLAARNCLVGANGRVKISDFGKLYQDYESDYYSANNYCQHDQDDNCECLPCPIRWMPPENLPESNDGVPTCSRKGDIWAYGVLLFEIWTRGSTPFDGLDDDEVIQALLSRDTPADHFDVKAKSYVKNIMENCWLWEAELRWNFKMIKEVLVDSGDFN